MPFTSWAAVMQNGLASKFAFAQLKVYKKVVLAAIGHNIFVLRLASIELTADVG